MSLFNYSSTLFSGFKTSSTGSFSGLLGEYSGIKNGSYRKLLKTYYRKFNADGTLKASSTEDVREDIKKRKANAVTDSAADLKKAGTAADALMSAATALAAVKDGSSSLYAKKALAQKGEDGSVSTKNDYDYDTLTKKTKQLVSAYNDTLNAVSKFQNAAVSQKTKWVTQLSDEFSQELSNVGLSFDKDGRMALDEDKLRATDMADIQKLFEGSASFTGKLAQKASGLSSAAEVQSLRAASAYNGSGTKYDATAMNAGSIFDSLF